MRGPNVQTCLSCDGKGGGRCEDSGAWVACEGCAGSGLLADCVECGEPQPYPEAATHGAFCEACRIYLDRRDNDEERRLARRMWHA